VAKPSCSSCCGAGSLLGDVVALALAKVDPFWPPAVDGQVAPVLQAALVTRVLEHSRGWPPGPRARGCAEIVQVKRDSGAAP